MGGSEDLAGHGGAGDADQNHVVQTDTVECVLQCNHALDFVGHDHVVQYVADGNRFALNSRSIIGTGEDGSEVIAGVTPLSGQPCVVVVQPPDLTANVERGHDRVQLVTGAGNRAAVFHFHARHDWTEHLGAGREFQSQQSATDGIEETQSSCVASDIAEVGFSVNIVGDVGEEFVCHGFIVLGLSEVQACMSCIDAWGSEAPSTGLCCCLFSPRSYLVPNPQQNERQQKWNAYESSKENSLYTVLVTIRDGGNPSDSNAPNNQENKRSHDCQEWFHT